MNSVSYFANLKKWIEKENKGNNTFKTHQMMY